MNNKKYCIIIRELIVVIVLICIVCNGLLGCNKKTEGYNAIYFELNGLKTLEYIESVHIDDEVTKLVLGKNVTAVYNKTLYNPVGQVTKKQYNIIDVEDNDTESDLGYIELNDMGEVVGSSSELGYIDIKCQLDYEQDSEFMNGYYSFGLSKEEFRVTVEEALGDMVDWSLYETFSVDFIEPSPYFKMLEFPYPIYTSVVLTWRQCVIEENGKSYMNTGNAVSCTLFFASYDKKDGEDEGCEHVFYDKVKITEFHIENPLNEDMDKLSKYVDRIHRGPVSDPNSEFLTIYNGKVCYYVKEKSRIAIYTFE